MKKIFLFALTFALIWVCASALAENRLTLPASMKIIEAEAFMNNTAITEVVIPEGCVSIGENAFAGCKNLTKINIPDSVRTIGENAFAGCVNVRVTVVTDSYALEWCEANGIAHVENLPPTPGLTYRVEDGNAIITGVAEREIHDLVIPSVIDGYSVVGIDDGAFSECWYYFGRLIIPNSVTSIGTCAFYDCCGFTGDLIIPDSVKKIGREAFRRCSGFTGNLVIPDSVTEIGEAAFYNCYGFTGDLVIPDSVTEIGAWVFFECEGFNGNLIIPDSVTKIGKEAFYRCRNFTGNLVIPDSVTSIGENAFWECMGFTGNLIIPDSVTSIEACAFEGCSGFTGNLIISNNVTSIGAAAFYNCYGFTGNLVIPDSVTSIEAYAFEGCSGFTSITFSGSEIEFNDPFEFCNPTSVYVKSYSSNIYNFFRDRCTVYVLNQSTGEYQDMAAYHDTLTKFWGVGAIPSNLKPFTNETVTVTAAIFGGAGALTYQYDLQYEGHSIETSGSISDAEFSFVCDQAGQYQVLVTAWDEEGQIITCASDYILAVDPTPAAETAQQTEMQKAILGTITNLCDNVLTPDNVICVLKDESITAFDQLVFMAEDVVNFNLGDLNWSYNKVKYLFEDAMKRCSTTQKMDLFNKDVIIEGELKDAMDLLDNSRSFNAAQLYDTFNKMCNKDLLKKIDGGSVGGLIEKYISGKSSLDDLTSSLSGVGMNNQQIGSVVSNLDWLKKVGKVADVLGAISDGKRVFDSCINVLNQINVMKSMDKEKMLHVAQIYQNSDDLAMQLVGQKLMLYYNASYEAQIALIATGELIDVGLEAMTGYMVKAATSALSGSFLAAVQLTDAVINVMTGAGDIPGKIYEINFSADAVRSSYTAFTSAYNAYKAKQNETTLAALCYAYINYHEVSAKAEDAFEALYKTVEDSVLGSTLITDEMRNAVKNAKTDAAAMRKFAGDMSALYDFWKSGDAQAFKEGVERMNAEYQEALKSAGA